MLNCLVDQELAQLEERPTIAQSPLFFTAGELVGTLSNSGQIFQSNSLFARFSPSYQSVADGVIYQFLKAFFLARQPFQQFSTSASSTSGASRSLLLEIRSELGVMISNFGNFFTAKFISFGCHNNVSSAQITTQNFRDFLWFWWCRFKLYVQIVITIFTFTQSCCFRFLPFQQSNLVVPDSQRESLSTIDSCQTYSPILLFSREGTSIVGRASRSKTPNWFTIFFRRLSVARNSSNGVFVRSSPTLSLSESLLGGFPATRA